MNEMSSNQEEYNQLFHQNQNNNVSSFYNDEIEERQDPLRIPNHDGIMGTHQRESSNFSIGKDDIELQQPIMQMMQMHHQHQ